MANDNNQVDDKIVWGYGRVSKFSFKFIFSANTIPIPLLVIKTYYDVGYFNIVLTSK